MFPITPWLGICRLASKRYHFSRPTLVQKCVGWIGGLPRTCYSQGRDENTRMACLDPHGLFKTYYWSIGNVSPHVSRRNLLISSTLDSTWSSVNYCQVCPFYLAPPQRLEAVQGLWCRDASALFVPLWLTATFSQALSPNSTGFARKSVSTSVASVVRPTSSGIPDNCLSLRAVGLARSTGTTLFCQKLFHQLLHTPEPSLYRNACAMRLTFSVSAVPSNQ